MRVTFLGTGEACDQVRATTSILIEQDNSLHLLDCGFTAAQQFIRQAPPEKSIESVWISHFHGDHFFGLPQLILYLHQQGRTSPLTVLSGTHAKDKVEQCMEMAYAGLLTKLSYPIHYVTVPTSTSTEHNGLHWQAAPVIHSKEPFGLLIIDGSKRLYYSGDGKPTNAAEQLMKDCDLVIHEAYTLTDTLPTHCSVEECIELAVRLQLKRLTLIHLSAEALRDHYRITALVNKSGLNRIFLAKEGESIQL